jgi:hypothetical protein
LNRRGALVDRATQIWVVASGRRVRLAGTPWLRGPTGATDRIGPDYFERLAASTGLVLRTDASTGLMRDFDRLAGPGFDPSAVDPRVRDFYEHTASYQLDVWSEWSAAFRPFGALLAVLFSRRLEQMNVPLRSLSTRLGMSSEVVQLVRPDTGEIESTGWVRRNPATAETVYVGSYSVADVPGHPAPCVRVVFPLPNGNATVVLRVANGPNGALVLESSGARFGDAGFYFLVARSADEVSVRRVGSFRERIEVYVDDAGTLRTDHVFTLWRRTFLRLHYRIERAPLAAG